MVPRNGETNPGFPHPPHGRGPRNDDIRLSVKRNGREQGMANSLLHALPWRLLCCALATIALAGCERGMHEMYDQPKYKPLTSSPLWANGNSSRPQVPGTQPYSAGALAGVSSGRMDRVALVPPAGPVSGVDANGKPLARAGAAAAPGYSNPLPITPKLLARGRQRFNIYCAPCHSRAGDGDGMIARRGFPHPPSYHTAALRNAPDSHFYKVISNGYGVMYPYADRISPHDRWAIVAYIRALQLSQHAPRSDLSAQDLQKLGSPKPFSTNASPSGSGAGVGVRTTHTVHLRTEPSSEGTRKRKSGVTTPLLPEGEVKQRETDP
jgi:mono/diheme cytochrome c family protein